MHLFHLISSEGCSGHSAGPLVLAPASPVDSQVPPIAFPCAITSVFHASSVGLRVAEEWTENQRSAVTHLRMQGNKIGKTENGSLLPEPVSFVGASSPHAAQPEDVINANRTHKILCAETLSLRWWHASR